MGVDLGMTRLSRGYNDQGCPKWAPIDGHVVCSQENIFRRLTHAKMGRVELWLLLLFFPEAVSF